MSEEKAEVKGKGRGVPERCLLERGVPVSLINADARKEKLGTAKPPISEMHYYHTRKPLIISRLAVAGTLLGKEDAPTDEDLLNKLFGLDPTLKTRGYRRIPQEILKRIRERYPEGVTILDPFAGTGMILFEALRLGCDVVGVDYNPVACLIARATLEYPLKFNSLDKDGEYLLYKDVKKHAEEIFEKLKEELERFYPPYRGRDVKAYIHAWAVKCPHCGKETPLVQNWWLDSENGVYLAYEVAEDKSEIRYSIKKGKAPEGSASEGDATCLFCTAKIENDHVVKDISENERERLLAVYLGKGEFAVADEEQREALEKAKEYLQSKIGELARFVPTEPTNLEIASHRYLQSWYRLYNTRQLLVLTSLAREIRKKVEDLVKEYGVEYASAVGTYLSLILAKLSDRNSRSVRWDSSYKVIGSTMSMRRPSMIWNHAETNPFVKFSGSLSSMAQDVLDGLKFALSELNGGGRGLETSPVGNARHPDAKVINTSILSWNTDRKFKFIITDPPYYDDVQYPEILQYFQVWHARTVGDLLGFTATPNTSEELSVGRHRDERTYEQRMLLAIRKLYDLLDDDGILTVFFVHKKVEAWKYLLEALRRSGFKVTSTVALWTEGAENVIARGKSSIFHSLLLTARKRTENKRANLIEVEEEIRERMLERYPELERIYGRDRVNLMVAASGIVLEVVTSYSEITSFTKDLPEYALEAGQRFLVEAFARRVIGLENVDPQTMLYVWLRSAGPTAGGESCEGGWIDYTTFNQTLKALGLSEESVGKLIEKGEGSGKSRVRLLDYAERAPLEVEGMEPLVAGTLIEAAQLTLREYTRNGPAAAIEYAKGTPYGAKSVLKVLKALAEICATDAGYREGEAAKKLLEDWGGVGQLRLPV